MELVTGETPPAVIGGDTSSGDIDDFEPRLTSFGK